MTVRFTTPPLNPITKRLGKPGAGSSPGFPVLRKDRQPSLFSLGGLVLAGVGGWAGLSGACRSPMTPGVLRFAGRLHEHGRFSLY